MNRENKRILIVERHLPLLQAIERLLVRQGYQIDTVLDSAAALEKLHASHFDLLVLDAMWPDLEGVKLGKEVRADPELHALSILLMFARACDRPDLTGELVQEIGANNGITKPFSAESLCAHVDRLLFGRHIGTIFPYINLSFNLPETEK